MQRGAGKCLGFLAQLFIPRAALLFLKASGQRVGCTSSPFSHFISHLPTNEDSWHLHYVLSIHSKRGENNLALFHPLRKQKNVCVLLSLKH